MQEKMGAVFGIIWVSDIPASIFSLLVYIDYTVCLKNDGRICMSFVALLSLLRCFSWETRSIVVM